MLVLQGHFGPIQSLAYSPDGATLASASYDRTVRLWDVATSRERAVLTGHSDPVFAVAFAPDGRTLASGGLDENIRLWDALEAKKLAELEGHTSFVNVLAFAPDGQTLASGAGNRIDVTNQGEALLWDVAARTERDRLTTQRLSFIFSSFLEGFYECGGIWSLGYTPDGQALILGTGSGNLLWWDLAEGKEKIIAHQDAGVRALAVGPEGRLVATAAGYEVRLWNAVTGEELPPLVGHQGQVSSVAFSPNGQTLASGGKEGTVILWDLASRQQRAAFNWEIGKIHAVAFSPDGMTAAAAGDRHSILVWDVAE